VEHRAPGLGCRQLCQQDANPARVTVLGPGCTCCWWLRWRHLRTIEHHAAELQQQLAG
jgi:hypothetical protein